MEEPRGRRGYGNGGSVLVVAIGRYNEGKIEALVCKWFLKNDARDLQNNIIHGNIYYNLQYP